MQSSIDSVTILTMILTTMVMIINHCTHLSDFIPPSQMGQMKRQWQYQWKAIHPHTATVHAATGSDRSNITYSGCSSAPCTPAPKRGMVISCGTSITHSPQRSVPQTRTKTPPCLWRSGPRPLLSVNAAGRILWLSIHRGVRGGLSIARP